MFFQSLALGPPMPRSDRQIRSARWIHIGGDEVVAESWWTSDHTRHPTPRRPARAFYGPLEVEFTTCRGGWMGRDGIGGIRYTGEVLL